MNYPIFKIDMLSLFSSDRQVYRAFDHLILSRMGTLLLVPPSLVVGGLDGVVDKCPVPHEEVYAVLTYPHSNIVDQVNPHVWTDEVQQLEYLGIGVSDCEMDLITPMVNGEEKVLRLVHPSGIRYAVVLP